MPKAPNPTGRNQHGDHNWPSDEELRPELMLYAVEALTIKERKDRFFKKFGMPIGKTSLTKFNNRLEIPSVRRPPPLDYCEQLIMEEVQNDSHGGRGSATVQGDVQRHQHVLIPRHIVRSTLALNHPDTVTNRMRGKKPTRTPLRAIGPDFQHHSDGWEKCGALALAMGGVGVPVYAAKDQYSSKYVHSSIVPNDRLEDVVVHVYLDRVELIGIPITEITDKGSEHGVMATIAHTLRTEFAPQLSTDVALPRLGLSSTKNTPIEGGWHCLREYSGHNLANTIKEGRAFFNSNSQVQRCLFYWIWPPVVQAEMDDYTGWWNSHRIAKQSKKANPSGFTPNHAYAVPETLRPPGEPCLISVPRARIQEIRADLVLTRAQAMSFVSESFDADACQVYDQLTRPVINREKGWAVFHAMLPHLMLLYPRNDPEPAFVFTL